MGFFDSVVKSVKSAASSAISSVSSKISSAVGGLVSGAMGSISSAVGSLSSSGGASALKMFASSSGALGDITSSIPKSMSNTFSFGDSKAILASLDLEGKLDSVSKLADMKGATLDKLTTMTGKSILSDADLSSVTSTMTGKFADISFPNADKLLTHGSDLIGSSSGLIDALPSTLSSLSDNLVKEYKPLMSSTMDMLTSIPDKMDNTTFTSMADTFTNGIGSFCTDPGLTDAFTKADTRSLGDTAKAFLGFAGKAMDYDLPILSSFPGITKEFKIKDVVRLGLVAKSKGAKDVLKSIVSEKTASFIDDPKKYALDTVRNVKIPSDELGNNKFPQTIGDSLDEMTSLIGTVKTEVMNVRKDYTNKSIIESLPDVFDKALMEDVRRTGVKVLGTDIEADVDSASAILSDIGTGSDIATSASGTLRENSKVFDIDVIQDEKAFDRVMNYFVGDKRKLFAGLPSDKTIKADKTKKVIIGRPWVNPDTTTTWESPNVKRSNPIKTPPTKDEKITVPWVNPDKQDTVDWGYA